MLNYTFRPIVGLILVAASYGAFLAKCEIVYNESEWLLTPPADSDSLPVYISYASFDDELNVVKVNDTGYIKIKNDSIYLPLGHLPYRGGNTGWIRGIDSNGKLSFDTDEAVAKLKGYDISEYRDSIPCSRDLLLWGAEKFQPRYDEITQTSGTNTNRYKVKFDIAPKLEAAFNRATGLVHAASSGFIINDIILTSMETYINHLYSPASYTVKPSQVVSGFIVGKLSDREPESLPAPKISLRWSESVSRIHGGFYSHTFSPEVDLQMNITNADGTLIDSERIIIKMWVNGKRLPDMSFQDVGNPYGYPCLYAIKLPISDEQKEAPEIHGFCYYRKKNGGAVKSPEFRYDPAGIILPTAPDDELQECQTFDLTGRAVNGENLSPGIYIRNGRKFVVY